MLLLVSGRTIVLTLCMEGPDAASSEWEDHSLASRPCARRDLMLLLVSGRTIVLLPDPVHGGT